MRNTNVDFEYTRNWGSIKKGDVESYDKAFARSLQDIRKVGKIIGPTKSEEDIEALKEAEKLIQAEVEKRVGDLKKENKALKAANTKMKRPPSDKTDKKASQRQTK